MMSRFCHDARAKGTSGGRRAIAAFAALAAIALLSGCSRYGKIEGKVVDKLADKPIPGASVTVKGTSLTVLTDDAGRYDFSKVIPGAQQILASKEGYIALGAVDIATARGTKAAAATLYMMRRPPGSGLYRVDGEGITGLPQVSESKLNFTGAEAFSIPASNMPATMPVGAASPLTAMLYDGGGSPAPQGVSVIPLRFNAASVARRGFMQFMVPARFEAGPAIAAGVAVESIGPGLTGLRAELLSGTYCVRVRRPVGVPDGYYIVQVRNATQL